MKSLDVLFVIFNQNFKILLWETETNSDSEWYKIDIILEIIEKSW